MEIIQNIEVTSPFYFALEDKKALEAVSYNISKSTIAYVDSSRLLSGAIDVASGVLVEINERFFLATTAHSISGNPNGNLCFVRTDLKYLDGNPTEILSFAKDTERDVAFIELTRKYVENQSSKAAIPLSRIHACGPGKPNVITLVAGYPRDTIRDLLSNNEVTSWDQVPNNIFFRTLCSAHLILAPDDWDELSDSIRKPDEERDAFILYTQDDDTRTIGPLAGIAPDDLPEPFGMSGGGYWQPNHRASGLIFTPESSLIAIQSTWWGKRNQVKRRHLQGTQIIHWIRLLWNNLEDLRITLEDAFPNQKLS